MLAYRNKSIFEYSYFFMKEILVFKGLSCVMLLKLSVSLMNCPLTIANFGITSTNNAFLINAILTDVLCNFYVILFNLM